MGALPNPSVSASSVSTVSPFVPCSAADELRRRTDFDADTGYAPLYFGALAELPRLSSGPVCTHFLLFVGALSYGRADKPKKGRQEWTAPVTVEYLAELCRCHVRDIQRQIRDLAKPSAKNPEGRGLIAVKANRRGEYSLSPLYRAWAKLPDYVSGGPKVVAIDDPEETEDDTPVEVSKDAVRLVKRPQVVRGGKTCRAIPVKVGVSSMRIQHVGSIPLVFEAVIDKGQLLIASRYDSDNSEDVANARRHGCRDGSAQAPRVEHPRAPEIVALFDPLLEKSGSRLLIGDDVALQRACEAAKDLPHDVLVHGVMAGANPRGGRPISGPKVVASIVAEVYVNWKASAGRPAKPVKAAALAVRSSSRKTADFVGGVMQEAIRRLDKFGRL